MDDNIFSKELQEEFIKNIQALKEETPTTDPGENSPKKKDIKQNTPEKKKPGRKNRGLTAKSYEEKKARQKAYYHSFMDIKSPDSFNSNIVEHVTGEIIADDDINQFKELYQLTCDTILANFRQNNPELVKKHPYNWYKPLLLEIKKNVQRITADDLNKCIVVWDCLASLLFEIGLYPTFEFFQFMTNIYKYQLQSRAESSPAYADFVQKIKNETEGALIGELSACPYNQTNKIFLAKVAGIIEKTEPKQIEVTHTIRNYDSLPMFGDNSNENS